MLFMHAVISSEAATLRLCEYVGQWEIQGRLIRVPVQCEHRLNVSVPQDPAIFFMAFLIPSDSLADLLPVSTCPLGEVYSTDAITVPTEITSSTFHESFVPLPTGMAGSLSMHLRTLCLHSITESKQAHHRARDHLRYQHAPLFQ
jgi:hypothetical protein